MTGAQIIASCASIAQLQYPEEPVGAAQCEIELLRTKVLELSLKLERKTAPMAAALLRMPITEADLCATCAHADSNGGVAHTCDQGWPGAEASPGDDAPISVCPVYAKREPVTS